jgi:DNA transposition AAA+ family ATPase
MEAMFTTPRDARPQDKRLTLTNLTETEVQTIRHGLEGYGRELTKTYNDVEGTATEHEDRYFVTEQLALVHGLLFALLEDHGPEDRDEIREWLGV